VVKVGVRGSASNHGCFWGGIRVLVLLENAAKRTGGVGAIDRFLHDGVCELQVCHVPTTTIFAK
jgi:hypothetical protein